MPRSKRAKIVHLSKTTKKGKDLTLRLHASVQECIPEYLYIYVFRVDNMRNTYLKDVRAQLADSRLFFGKTKVMAVALGLTAESEPYPNTSKLVPHLHGSVGLIFSPRSPSDMLSYFANFQPADYARSGTLSSRSFTIPSGTLYSRGGEVPEQVDVPLSHSVEPSLRKLGVPTKLIKGRVQLENDFLVCKEGEVLGSGQTALLKIFGVAAATFKVQLVACFNRETGQVEPLEKQQSMTMDVDDTTDIVQAEE